MHYEERLLAYLRRADLAAQTGKGGVLRPFDLTPAQQNVLAVVNESPGITGAELARRAGVTPQTINTTVSRLTARAYLSRSAHPVHRTLIELRLTPEGERAFTEADRAVADYDAALSQKFTDGELATLKDLLGRLAVSLQASG